MVDGGSTAGAVKSRNTYHQPRVRNFCFPTTIMFRLEFNFVFQDFL